MTKSRNTGNDHFFQSNKEPTPKGVFVPLIYAQIRPKFRVAEVLHETPGTFKMRLVDDKFLKGERTVWLGKRDTQLAGDHVYIDRHVAVREGLV